MKVVTVNVEAEFIRPRDFVVEKDMWVYEVDNSEEFHTTLKGTDSVRLPKVTLVTVIRQIGSESDD